MESNKTTIFFGCLSNFGLLTRIFNGRLKRGYKLIARILFLCLGLHLFLSSVYAQGPGLYKDGKKILDFEEMVDSSFQPLKAAPLLKETAGMKFYKQIFGEKIPSRISPQKEYVHLVLRCRDLVRRITFYHGTDSLPTEEIDQLLSLEQKVSSANQALLKRFSEIETSLKNNGYPAEKIDRHTKMVEGHTIAADHLLDLLANLRVAHTSDDRSALENIVRELEQYFIDNIFRHDPPLLSSQPLPVMMEIKKAPIIEDQLPQAIPYPTVMKGERGPQPGDLDPTIDVQFTDEIIDLAASRNNSPIEMYNYVRDNFEFEAYLGSRKGSQQTLDHRRGNDYDQASLLIALLRVSGIPARYARAKVKIPIEQATNWLGIQDKKNAGSILTTCGMEGIIYIVNDDTVAIGCRRVWVEAWLPFINYRGAINDSIGFMWVPMDPTFKQYEYKPGINLLAEIDFDAEAFVFDYISTFHSETPIEMFREMLLDSLAIYHPGADYDDLITTRSVIKETDGILPGTLPYELMEQDAVFSEIPSDMRYQIEFVLSGSGISLSYSTSLPEIVEKQLTISYVGATAADQEIIDTAGGIFNVDVPYLVDLVPVLKIDGCEVARGSGSVMMGITHNSYMHFTAPVGASNQMPTVSNTIIAGNYQGLGIDTEDAFPAFFDVPETSCPEDYLGQELHQTALTYLNNVDVASDEAADLMHIKVVNGVAEAIVENTLRVLFSGGLPVTFEWTGMIVDADRRIIGPFSIDGVDNSCDYMRLVGAEGSIQENRLFEDRFGQEAISAIKILELASDSGITVCEITYSIAAECPGINQPASVISAINNALAQGHHAIIPKRQFTYYLWTGTGWIDLDPVTCAAGYIISGGKNGGETVQEWDITYPDLFCIEPIGPITVTPPATGDLYCAENTAKWTFTVPTIKYWGKDEDDNCELLKTEGKDFPVKYTIKYIADNWGPGEYIFKCGSYTTECGCTMIEKTVTIFKVEIDKPNEAEVFLKGEELRFESKIEPSGLGTFTYAWSVTEGTCTPASGSNADFEATLVSVGTIKVKLEATISGVPCEDERTIESVLPEVTKISWKGDHDLREWGGADITDPVWIRPLGGSPTKNKPGVYTKGASATAELEIEASKSLANSASVQVKGDGDENFYPAGAYFHHWTWASGELQLSSSPLYASVNFYDNLDVLWQYRVQTLDGGWGEWVDMNQSTQVLYTVHSKPAANPIYDRGVSKACRYANGAADFAGAINVGFAGELYYDPRFEQSHTLSIFDIGSGQCCCHAAVFCVLISHVTSSTPSPEYCWGGCCATCRCHYKYGLSWGPTFQCDRPAHDWPSANPHFTFHVQVPYDGVVYDPSYGLTGWAPLLETAPAIPTHPTAATFQSGNWGATTPHAVDWTCPH